MKKITFEVPEAQAGLDWLVAQLEKLNAIKHADRSDTIDYYDDGINERNSEYAPGALLLAIHHWGGCDDGWLLYHRVIFHVDGTCFMAPPEEPFRAWYAHGGDIKGYETKWEKGSWFDGLLSLAQSIAKHLRPIEVQKAEAIAAALQNFITVVGDTKAEPPAVVAE